METIGRTRREAVVGTIGGDIKAVQARQSTHLRGYFRVAMRHMHIAAPLDDLEPVLNAKIDDLLRRELTEGDRYKSGKHKNMSGHAGEHVFGDAVLKWFASQIEVQFAVHPIAHASDLSANAAGDVWG